MHWHEDPQFWSGATEPIEVQLHALPPQVRTASSHAVSGAPHVMSQGPSDEHWMDAPLQLSIPVQAIVQA